MLDVSASTRTTHGEHGKICGAGGALGHRDSVGQCHVHAKPLVRLLEADRLSAPFTARLLAPQIATVMPKT